MVVRPDSSGPIDFVYDGETFQTWYKLVGDLTSKSIPLVVANGGPGFPHDYTLPHTLLHEEHGMPVIFYDQIGCGRATHLKDRPAAFWSIDLYTSELDNLLSFLGISANFNLLGHSWGGMLAQEFVVKYQPAGLRRLILADTLASMDEYAATANRLLRALPQHVQDVIKKHEEAGTTDSEEFKEACDIFYKKHLCLLDPWPKELQEAFAIAEEDMTVYVTMQGPSEFTITGTLKSWTIVDRLHLISTPTLIINGAEDTCQEECVAPMFREISRAKWVQFGKSGHLPFWDEQERYMRVVGDWLREG